MKTKWQGFFIITAALLLCALAAVCLVPRGPKELLLALPKDESAVGCAVDRGETIHAQDFMLTYENRQDIWIDMLFFNGAARLIGTNYAYPFVVGAHVISGSFFTKEQSNTSVTLNEKASFDIFGDMHTVGLPVTLYGKPYLVSGVIRDGDAENRNIYISANNLDLPITAFAASLHDTPQEIVLNRLSQEGIHESGYTLLNVSLMHAITRGKLEVAIKSAMCIVLYGVLQKKKKQLQVPLQWLCTALWIGFTIGMTQSFLEICLYWYDMPIGSGGVGEGFSAVTDEWLAVWHGSDLLFAGFLAAVVAGTIRFLHESKKQYNLQAGSVDFSRNLL